VRLRHIIRTSFYLIFVPLLICYVVFILAFAHAFAQVDEQHTSCFKDGYGDIPADEFPEDCDCVGRSYFARSLPDGKWIYFGDLPEATLAEIERLMSEGFYKDPVTNDRLSTGIMDDIRNNRLGGA
jgi:hypothetical protein